MKKKLILILVLAIALAAAGYIVYAEFFTLKTFHSDELGLSFDYSRDLKVYQQDEDNILIKAEYINPENSAVSIEMGIKKINSEPETRDEINFRLQGGQITSEETRGGYSILRWGEGSQYYMVSDKGTFYVGDTLDTPAWKEIFEREGLYEKYRLKFDNVRNSIRFD